LNVKEWKEKAA